MRPIVARLALFVVALGLAGCGTFRAFSLPLDAWEGRKTLPQVRAAAEQEGYKPSYNDEAVWFDVDAETSIQFRTDGGFEMIVQVAKSVPPEQVEERVKAGKAKGDAVWQKAIEIRRSLAP